MKGLAPEERARRIYEASRSGWRRQVTDIMSRRYMIYHWSMPLLLAAEAAVLLFLAIWPIWCGIIVFIAAGVLCDNLNELVAYLAWKRYDRLRNKAALDALMRQPGHDDTHVQGGKA